MLFIMYTFASAKNVLRWLKCHQCTENKRLSLQLRRSERLFLGASVVRRKA